MAKQKYLDFSAMCIDLGNGVSLGITPDDKNDGVYIELCFAGKKTTRQVNILVSEDYNGGDEFMINIAEIFNYRAPFFKARRSPPKMVGIKET